MSASQKSVVVISLRQLETKVKVLVRDLHPDSITELTASYMKGKLKVISDAKDVFRNAVRAHLVRFARELTAAEKNHWEATMAATVKIAVVH